MSSMKVDIPQHIIEIRSMYECLLRDVRKSREIRDDSKLKKAFGLLADDLEAKPDESKILQVLSALEIASIAVNEIGLGATSVLSIMLVIANKEGRISEEAIELNYGIPVVRIVKGLKSIYDLSERTVASQAENFRNFLLNLAGDVRVILIKIAEHLHCMRTMNKMPQEHQIRMASDAAYLYAPLAHRLGFYLIKSEMEDLSLKYTDRKTYDRIARMLAQKMRERKELIKEFIAPVEDALRKQDLKFEIKGRPKSIHSIWNKMVNKGVDFEDIYDLFAIRIIVESEASREKADCWKVYSTVTDIYQPNPLRLRDWISMPKTNGYEALHTTVVGPDGRWVEVQIRTTRMNEIAEKGFAAHWKYKGMESDQGLEEWLGSIREVLETPEPDAKEFMDDFKLSLYSKEIFVFTPKGDLKKFPEGATVLDFAYDIHSEVGSTCTGARINGRSVPIRHLLQNGDRVEIITSKNQSPKIDWLNFVVTSRAKTKIRFKLNEVKVKEAENGREMLMRRLKNWKIPFSDDGVRKLLKTYKIKTAQDLYYKISVGEIDLAEIKELLQEHGVPEKTVLSEPESLEAKAAETIIKPDDFLVIDQKVRNVDFKLAKCCNPILGDEIFGFVTVGEGIKVHRLNCPNAAQLISKYGYRVVKAQWRSGAKSALFSVEITIQGENDPNILNNISNVLSKDLKINLQSFSLDSSEGQFKGRMKITVKDTGHLDALISKLSAIKGVYRVNRVERYNN
ncbi:MAG: bifunctional (p)ppGpp synthetase/guanosine-3',5'-bis(diphosphate) 3'-pyrophosphohydrolase [Bacteroidales bacterium]|nr:bifunctional (p)ppGpp synthetase/guanosine-3',5'-bis(diphosphate) 3'-pyrophosphohydrolase [Bacteroidales bacterium]